MDHDAASTPGERKVWQEKIRQREADLKARGCCHDALSVLQKSAHARTSRYLSENVKQRYHQCTNIECSATFRTTEAIDEVIRPRRRKRCLSRSRSHSRHPVKCRAATARHTVINQGELTMTTLTLQQAFEACQKNETARLNCKAELAAAEQEYREQVLAGDERIPGRMQTLRDIIDVKNGR